MCALCPLNSMLSCKCLKVFINLPCNCVVYLLGQNNLSFASLCWEEAWSQQKGLIYSVINFSFCKHMMLQNFPNMVENTITDARMYLFFKKKYHKIHQIFFQFNFQTKRLWRTVACTWALDTSFTDHTLSRLFLDIYHYVLQHNFFIARHICSWGLSRERKFIQCTHQLGFNTVELIFYSTCSWQICIIL